MNVLIACEKHQKICKEFRKRGHNAYSCDLERCTGGHPEWHIVGDVMNVLYPKSWIRYPDSEKPAEMFGSFKTEDGTVRSLPPCWDLVIADPPGEFISKSGARWMYPKAGKVSKRRLNKAMKQKEFFLKLFEAPVEKICVTAPIPLKVVEMPSRDQIVHPYQFGEPYSKATCLYLKNLESLKPTNVLEHYEPWICSNTSVLAREGYRGSHGVAHTENSMSLTFDGIAEAMAEQWGGEVV